MLTAQDLLDIRNIAVAASMFTNADFVKATQVHADKLKALQVAHQLTLDRATEQQRIKVNAIQNSIQEEEKQLKLKLQNYKEDQEKLQQAQDKFKTSYEEHEQLVAKTRETLRVETANLASQKADILRRTNELNKREQALALAEDNLRQEKQAFHERLNKMKALAA